MNKKVIVVSLLAALLVPAANGFAQGGKIVKNLNKLNPAKLERMVTQGVDRLAPRVPGIYIPAGTTVGALGRKIALTAQKAGVKLDEKEVRVIASHPEALRQFQVQTGMAIFEGRPLPVQEGLKVLKANQENFAQARAEGKYETAWEAFLAKKKGYGPEYDDPFRVGKSYGNPKEIADDVYRFYKFNNMDMKNLPHIRMVDVNDVEAVVLEIPVNGLSFTRPRPMEDEMVVDVEKFVVIHYEKGSNQIMFRETLERVEDGQAVNFRVIK